MVGRSAPLSTRPTATAASYSDPTRRQTQHRGHRPTERPPQRAGRQLSPGPGWPDYRGLSVHSLEPHHDPEAHPDPRATPTAAHDRMVLGGPSFPARARRATLARGGVVVLLPHHRG